MVSEPLSHGTVFYSRAFQIPQPQFLETLFYSCEPSLLSLILPPTLLQWFDLPLPEAPPNRAKALSNPVRTSVIVLEAPPKQKELKAYEGPISPLPSKDEWFVPDNGVLIGVPKSLRPRGRLKKNRFKNFLEGSSSGSRANHRCGEPATGSPKMNSDMIKRLPQQTLQLTPKYYSK